MKKKTDICPNQTPIYQSSSFKFESAEQAAALFSGEAEGYVYSRIGNPTVSALEIQLAELEGGVDAICTASGMAAMFMAIQNIVSVGDEIIASKALYGGTNTLLKYTLPKMGIKSHFLEEMTLESIQPLVSDKTKLILFETFSNPSGNIIDMESVCAWAKSKGIPTMADNTCGQGIFRPIEWGVNIVIHSLTKWIDGLGTSIGGAIIDAGNFDWHSDKFPDFITADPANNNIIYATLQSAQNKALNVAFSSKLRFQGLRDMGMCLSPMNAFMISQGLKTLRLRMKQHVQNAKDMANFLDEHPAVDWVNYVGHKQHSNYQLGQKYFKQGIPSLLTFGVKGGQAAGKAFIENVQLATHAVSIGETGTLVAHPASTTHSQLHPKELIQAGIRPETIRVSVGIEAIELLQSDFDQALKKACQITGFAHRFNSKLNNKTSEKN